jgi:transcriptional regulator with XRE-family HTH domain
MDTALAKTIGHAARAARVERGLSQADAAEIIGVSLEFYGRIERGGTLPSAPTLRSMARALSVGADTLLGLTGKAGVLTPRPVSTEAQEFPPELRRLVRRLRGARPRTLRLIAAVASAIEGRPAAKVRTRRSQRR